MKISCITLFPDMVRVLKDEGVVGRALQNGVAELELINPRGFTSDVHRTVDDRPYGGGPGMVMKAEPVIAAVNNAKSTMPKNSATILMSPQGELFNQDKARELAELDGIVLVAGRYEGIDERVMQMGVDSELSVGDYVLSGGELAAMVVIDSVVRLLPGALGHERSAQEDSFVDGLLDYPHFTRPENVDGIDIPEVLASGDHKKIARWRLKQALGRTWQRRPDLLEKRTLSTEEHDLLQEFIAEL